MNSRKVSGNRVKKGFTLVELLVVIGIIALLLAVLMPALNKAREQGKAMICLTNQKTIGMALIMYAEQNRGKLPNVSWIGKENGPELNEKWVGAILPYCGEQYKDNKRFVTNYFICPSRKEKMFVRPSNVSSVTACDYGVSFGSPQSGGLFNVIDGTDEYPGSKKISQVKQQSKIIMAMDTQVQTIPNRPGFFDPYIYVMAPYTPEHPNGIGNGVRGKTWAFDIDADKDGVYDTSDRMANKSPYKKYNLASPRHSKKINAVFVDGHCKKMETKDWAQKSHWVW